MQINGSDRLPELALSSRDAVIAVCGYEKRSTHLAGVLSGTAARRLCMDFQTGGNPQYDANQRWFTDNEYVSVPANVSDLVSRLRSFAFEPLASDSSPIDIVVDLSSMSRYLMAATVEALLAAQPTPSARVRFVYNASAYVAPPPHIVDVLRSAPASPFFAGSLGDTSVPISLIIGLGYEPGRALGCLDQFEAAQVFAFRPHGQDPRFEADIQSSNSDFLALVGQDAVFDYTISDPMELYQQMDSLVGGLRNSTRVVVVPFGPKIFAAAALILAVNQRSALSVWRVSGEGYEPPTDRLPTEEYAIIEVDLRGDA